MKTKASLIATAATMALFSSASGQTVIDLTGSTAGRSAVTTAVGALLDGETVAWSNNASLNSAGRAIFKGTFNGNAVIVRTFWSGSAAGVRDVADAPQLNNAFFQTSYDTVTNPGNVASPALASASAETVAEIGFSDVFQSSTSFTTNPLADETSVAVLPFVFMKNNGASSAITNVTSENFKAIWGGLGFGPMSLFTGNAGDASTTVFGTGRNNESGTRITTLAVTGTGVFASLGQWQGTAADPTVLSPFTAITGFTAGENGYSSGSSVANLLKRTTSSGQVVIGYVGIADAANATGATALSYEGVTYTPGAVYNGQYPFWGYLHQFSRDLSGDAVTQAFYDALKVELQANPGSGTLKIEDMNVERAADGAVITPL